MLTEPAKPSIATDQPIPHCEAASLDTETIIQSIVSSIPGMASYWDTNLRCQFANQAYLDWFGKTKEQIHGISLQDLQGAELFAKNESHIRLALAGKEQSFERQLIKANGEVGWVWAKYAPHSIKDQVVGFVAVVLDITERKNYELKLRKSETLNRTVFDSLLAHIAVVDAQGKIVEVNDAWRRYGSSNCAPTGAKDWIGTNYLDVCVSSGADVDVTATQAAEGLKSVLCGELSSFRLEYPCHSPTRQRWFRMSVLPMLGEVGGAVVSHEDVTDKVISSRALEMSNADLQRISGMLELTGALAKVGGWEVNLQTMKLTWTKETFRIAEIESAIEPPLEEAINLFAPEARPTISSALTAAIGNGTSYDLELPIIAANGQRKWIRTQGHADVTNGKASRIFGTFQDITERKIAEIALLESEGRRKVATDSGRVAIWEVDIKTGRLIWDDNCFLLYRMSKEDFRGTFEQWSGAIHPQDLDEVLQSFQNAVSGISEYDPSFRIIWPDGTVRYMQAHGEVLRDKEGIPERMIGTNWDITDLKRSEQAVRDSEVAQSANLAKSIFLANMSHEMRTPMSGVMGMIDLARGRAIDPQQIAWLDKGKRSAMHLMSVINDILDISKIEADRMTLEERNFSLSQVLDDAIVILDDLAHRKGLDLKLELDPSAPDLLCGDAMRLKQVVLNYLSNAIKFSEHGSVKLRTLLIEQNEDNVMLRIEVIDQGIGISAAHQARLFQSFTQADDSTTRKFGGTGLGLFISRRIAQMMGGDTGVISHEGQGSTFWATVRLRFAVEKTQTDVQSQDFSPRELLMQRFQGSHVLLVEDDEVNQEIGVLMLEAVGLVVEVARNGKEAVEKAVFGAYAAILMDVQMPVMNGLDATRAIRLLPGLQATPILAMSANAFKEDRERSLNAGMNDHIGKPVLPDALYSTLLRWMA